MYYIVEQRKKHKSGTGAYKLLIIHSEKCSILETTKKSRSDLS